MLDIRYWMLDAGCPMLDTRYWISIKGYPIECGGQVSAGHWKVRILY